MRACVTPMFSLLILAALSLTACSTTTNSGDALELANTSSHVEPASTKYPDFSRPLTSAMAQMTDAEASQMQAELSALSDGRKAGTISEADYWRRVKELEALAANHGQDTVTEIEKSQ